MILVQSINKNKKIYGVVGALLLTVGIGSGIAINKHSENKKAAAIELAEKAKAQKEYNRIYDSIYDANVLRADSIALADAIQAYNNIDTTKVKENYAKAQQKIEEAEHNLRVAQNTGTYKDMKNKEQILENVKNSKPIIEYNNMLNAKSEIIKSEAQLTYDNYLKYYDDFNGDIYYNCAQGYNINIKYAPTVDKRYQDVTGRLIDDDVRKIINNKEQ